MLQTSKHPLSAPAKRWGLWAVSFLLTAFGCVYYRALYLPVFQLTSLLPKLLVCGAAALAASVPGALVLGWITKKLGTPSLGNLAFAAISLCNFCLLFDSGELVCPTAPTKALLAVLTVLGAWTLCWGLPRQEMAKYRSKGAAAAILGISLYASLASFAQRFFLDGNTRMHFSPEGLFYCLSGLIWFLPIVYLGLFLLEALAARVPGKAVEGRNRKKDKWILFGCLLTVQGALLLILWPGFFPDDAYNQLKTAIGVEPLNDWHPVLVSLIQRLIMALTGNAGFIVTVQMFFWVWMLSAFLMVGYDHGISLKTLCILGSIFLVLPNQALSWSNAMKDYSFTLALVWATYLLLQLVLDTPWVKKWSFYGCLALDLFLLFGLRHNGMVPFAAMGIYCLWLTWKKFSQVKFRALASFLCAVLAVGLYKGPVFSALDVIPNIQSPFTSMLCAVGSYINKDLPLSQEAEEIMETVIPMEDWRDYYSRYEGHDVYYWGRPAGSVPYSTAEITGGKAFRVYFEALFKAPDIVIKDRLDGMDILWDVTMPPDSFNGNAFHYIFTYDEPLGCIPMDHMETEDGNRYYKQTPLAQAYFAATRTDIRGAADMLLWRTGAYMILLLVLLLFWWRNRINCLWAAAIPLFANGFASVLTVYHQSFRYVYFIQLIVLGLVFATVALRNRLTKPLPEEEGVLL